MRIIIRFCQLSTLFAKIIGSLTYPRVIRRYVSISELIRFHGNILTFVSRFYQFSNIDTYVLYTLIWITYYLELIAPIVFYTLTLTDWNPRISSVHSKSGLLCQIYLVYIFQFPQLSSLQLLNRYKRTENLHMYCCH